MTSIHADHQQILGYVLQAARTLIWLGLIVAIFAPLEHLFAVRRAKLLSRGWTVNFGWYFVNSLTSLLLLGPAAALLAWGVHAVLPATVTGAAADLPLTARMILSMIVGEVGFYWGHRWSHERPLLWRFHAIHHSAEQMTFLVNTRAHPIDMVFTRLCGLVLLYATGLASPVGAHPTLIPALVLLVGSMWSFFIHANLRWRLGLLEEVLASPFFHHWHHTREDHQNRNYAAMLPVMDRLFGTHYRPKAWPEAYGTATPASPTLVGQLMDPLAPRPNSMANASPGETACETRMPRQ